MYALSDPSDLVAITPGHFLIGEPASQYPSTEPDDGPPQKDIFHTSD